MNDDYPFILFIGDVINEDHADAARRAIHAISGIAEDLQAGVILGGTDMGVMAEVGKRSRLNHCEYRLIGIAPEKLVA